MTIDALFGFVENLESVAAGHETNVRGYKVKVSYRKIEDAEKKAKNQALGGDILARSEKYENNFDAAEFSGSTSNA